MNLRYFMGLMAVIFLFSCAEERQKVREADPEFKKYVTAFTSDVVSSGSTVRVRLAKTFGEREKEEFTGTDLFSFEPSLEGKERWIDDQTVEFIPSTRMPNGKIFDVAFQLGKVMDVPDDMEVFRFGFQTMTQDLSVDMEGMEPYKLRDLSWQKITGVVRTADYAPASAFPEVLEAKQNGRSLSVSWEHGSDDIRHRFVIDSVARREKADEVIVEWTGEPLGVDESGMDTLEVPSLKDFKIMDVKVAHEPSQHLEVRFSDPLDPDQELNGLIRLGSNIDIEVSSQSNVLKIYPARRQDGEISLMIEENIKNIMGYEMGEDLRTQVLFESIKPAVEFIGEGVVMPRSKDLHLPFKAVNLSAVDVRIVRIFEDNIPQFLQVNKLDGDDELRRVGKIIKTKKVDLGVTQKSGAGNWNTFSLDLEELIETEPGAIYRVQMGFRKEYSLYPCSSISDPEDDEGSVYDEDEKGLLSTEWGYYSNGYFFYDYDWDKNKDPCDGSYYYGRRNVVSKNVLASDLGILAKRGKNDQVKCVVTDLLSSKPKSGVRVTLYDYQQRRIASGTTDDNGMVDVKTDEEPYLLIADRGDQKGYLRVDDGSSLSMSEFETGGTRVKEGIKGFVYVERGVWRPGDSLHVMFILQDGMDKIPEHHPVTMKVRDPRGRIVKKIIRTEGVNGFYDLGFKTSKDAPTGNWSARVHVGGAEFYKRLRIETIKPNRLRMSLDLDGDMLYTGLGQQVRISSEWLHGAPASGLRAKISGNLYDIQTSFDGYEGYHFDDQGNSSYSSSFVLFDDELNEEGKATFLSELPEADNAPGMLRANLVTRVFEESGNSSMTTRSVKFSPYRTYVGMDLPETQGRWGTLSSDSTYRVGVVALDQKGRHVGGRDLEVEVYQIDWRWWWNHNGARNLSEYASRTYHRPVFSKELETSSNGKTAFNMKLDEPGWNRYYVRICDEEGEHCTGKVVYVSGYGRPPKGGENASMLSLETDKEEYEVGEEVTLSFPSSDKGQALISLESGKEVLRTEWIDLREKVTKYRFKVGENMAPNIYAHVTLIQPHGKKENDLPIRLYGVVPVSVLDPDTKLQPELEMPDELAPNQNVSLAVSEKNGRKMTYTVAMVDEGLLDLTNFQTPAPWEHFYSKEALGVKTWDMFNEVIGAYGGKIESILSIGGGGTKGKKPEGDVNRFEPMVKFLGPFELEAGEEQQHSISMPNYIGSVRTMVIAGQNEAYGSTEKATPVKEPLMVLSSLPRVLGPEESVKLPVTAFVMEEGLREVSIEVQTNDMLQVKGEHKKMVPFSGTGQKTIDMDLKVASTVGKGKVKVIARSGGEKATHTIELKVRNPNPPIVSVKDGLLQAGEQVSMDFEPVGMKGTNKGVLEVSSIPPLNLKKRLDYLVRYPHGCVEQVTSSAFPQLFVDALMETDQNLREKIDRNVRVTLDKLRSFQLHNGGFAYWPGSRRASTWGSSYAGHFMLEAASKGYSLPVGMKRDWLAFQKEATRDWAPEGTRYGRKYERDELIQAYRLFTLALANEPMLGAMNRLKEMDGISPQAQWRLAAAYHLAGRKNTATSLISKITTDFQEYEAPGRTFGSSTRDRAMVLETLSLMEEKEEAYPIFKEIAEVLASDRWLSTQTSAFCLLGVSKFVGKTKSSDGTHYTYSFGGGNMQTVRTEYPVTQREISLQELHSGNLQISNKGNGTLYARLILEGLPEPGQEESEEKNLRMKVRYLSMDGSHMNISRIQQGEDFMAEVVVKNPGRLGDLEELALTRIFPSGWEIRNIRMEDIPSSLVGNDPEYEDYRDDRVLTYFDLDRYESKRFRVLLNASFSGRYYLPSVSCEAMYDRSVYSRKEGQWVEVVKPGDQLSSN